MLFLDFLNRNGRLFLPSRETIINDIVQSQSGDAKLISPRRWLAPAPGFLMPGGA